MKSAARSSTQIAKQRQELLDHKHELQEQGVLPPDSGEEAESGGQAG
jgi:hypothetical protein